MPMHFHSYSLRMAHTPHYASERYRHRTCIGTNTVTVYTPQTFCGPYAVCIPYSVSIDACAVHIPCHCAVCIPCNNVRYVPMHFPCPCGCSMPSCTWYEIPAAAIRSEGDGRSQSQSQSSVPDVSALGLKGGSIECYEEMRQGGCTMHTSELCSPRPARPCVTPPHRRWQQTGLGLPKSHPCHGCGLLQAVASSRLWLLQAVRSSKSRIFDRPSRILGVHFFWISPPWYLPELPSWLPTWPTHEWVLRSPSVCSTLVGACIEKNLSAFAHHHPPLESAVPRCVSAGSWCSPAAAGCNEAL